MIYLPVMFALLHGRFWRALAGLAILFATMIPALASSNVQASVMAPCAAEQTLPGPNSGCDDHPAKALTCGLAMCASMTIVTASPVLCDEPAKRAIIFPPAYSKPIVGATLPPDPFPPRTLNSA